MKNKVVATLIKTKVAFILSIMDTLEDDVKLPIMADHRGNIEGYLSRNSEGVLFLHCPWVINQKVMPIIGQSSTRDILSEFILHGAPKLCRRMFVNNPVYFYRDGTVAPDTYVNNLNKVWLPNGDDVECRDIFRLFENGTETPYWLMRPCTTGSWLRRLYSEWKGSLMADTSVHAVKFNGVRVSFLPYSKVDV